MALMERIIRPHLPATIAPVKIVSKCREEAKNQVAKFVAPANARVQVAQYQIRLPPG